MDCCLSLLATMPHGDVRAHRRKTASLAFTSTMICLADWPLNQRDTGSTGLSSHAAVVPPPASAIYALGVS